MDINGGLDGRIYIMERFIDGRTYGWNDRKIANFRKVGSKIGITQTNE